MPADTAPWPRADTFDAATLALEHGHSMYYEQSGAAAGIPVVVLHGGPGSGATPRHRDFFDAARYRIVQFDQRGCGRSEPLGATAHNHTAALVDDIERLRRHLGIDRWLVFGGSWGASLALAYAQRHRQYATGLVLRGLFLAGASDVDWFFQGAGAFAPEAHARFMQQVPARWRRKLVTWLDRTFQSDDADKIARVAAAWQGYEQALSSPDNLHRSDASRSTSTSTSPSASAALCATYTIQAHYLARRCFLGDRALLRAAASLGELPVAIVHGAFDLVCRPDSAWRAHRAMTGSRLAWAAGAGHDPYHPASLQLLRGATECFAADGNFARWSAGAST